MESTGNCGGRTHQEAALHGGSSSDAVESVDSGPYRPPGRSREDGQTGGRGRHEQTHSHLLRGLEEPPAIRPTPTSQVPGRLTAKTVSERALSLRRPEPVEGSKGLPRARRNLPFRHALPASVATRAEDRDRLYHVRVSQPVGRPAAERAHDVVWPPERAHRAGHL